MKANVAIAKGWLWLSAPIAILLAFAAGSGVLVNGLYRDAPILVPQLVGGDLVSLLVALPALVISAILVGRGSRRALVVWIGIQIYLAYTYMPIVFHARFNSLFLAYVALLGCALYALIGGLATVDLQDFRARFSARTPVKPVSIFMVIIVILFYGIWLSEDIPATLKGTVPPSVVEAETPTNAIHILDMAMLLPGVALGAVWLWKRRPLGYLLGGAILVKGFTLGLAVLSMTAYMVRDGFPANTEMAVVFVGIVAFCLGMLVWYLRSIDDRRQPIEPVNQKF